MPLRVSSSALRSVVGWTTLGSVALLAGCLSAPYPRSTADQEYREGFRLLGQPGQQSAAEAALRRAIAADATFAPPHLALARLRARQGGAADSEAIAEYERALQLEDAADVHYEFGVLLARQPGREADAFQHFRAATSAGPQRVAAWEALADLFRRTGHSAAAADAYRHALEVAPQRASLWVQLAATTDREAEAIEAYEKAVQLEPAHAAARHALGLLLEQQPGREADALGHLVAAVAASPQTAAYWLDLSRLHLRRGEFEAARRAAQRAIDLEPRGSAGYLARGDAWTGQKDYARAMADYRQAAANDPDNGAVVAALGRAYSGLGQKDEAQQAFTRAIELQPLRAERYAERARARLDAGRLPEALSDASRAIELEPARGEFRTLRGQIRQAAGDFAAALADFDEAIRLLPVDPQPRRDRSAVRVALGDIEGALADLRRLIDLYPDKARSYFTRGELRDDLGDLAGALDDFTKGIDADPRDTANLRARGILRDVSGDFTGALQDYERARARGAPDVIALDLWCRFIRRRLGLPGNGLILQADAAAASGSWSAELADFFLRSGSEEALFAAAGVARGTPVLQQRCAANYYAGMRRLLETDDAAGARRLFEEAVATGAADAPEYRFARVELVRMGR